MLAYELLDGRLKLLDGHLRRDLDPEMEVEVLDVDDGEARALLLTIDPLAALAQTQEQLRRRLLELVPEVSPEIGAARQVAEAAMRTAASERMAVEYGPEQFLVLVTCRDKKQQVELLGRFQGEGLECTALLPPPGIKMGRRLIPRKQICNDREIGSRNQR